MKNFIAYSAQIDEQEFFETHEEALEWLKKSDLEGAEIEGFSLEVSDGGSFIAKITHRSQYVEEENKEDFCHCEDEDCENEHWDYSQDSVGHIEYKEVSHGDKCHVKLGPECPPECKRNEPTLRGVCDLTINNCDGCDNKTGTPCKVTFDLYKCAKRQLGDLIADGNYVSAITLYNQIREKISNESKV